MQKLKKKKLNKMLLGENKEISSTTHQTLQKKKNNPKIWIPQLNMPSCHRERISEKKSTTTLRK